MKNQDSIIKDLEIVTAILNKITAQAGESDDIAYAQKILKGVINLLERDRLEIITGNADAANGEGDIPSASGNSDLKAKITAENKETITDMRLPCGRKLSEHNSCPNLSRRGACTMHVLTSYPPQYKMCPARGVGFIKCSEA